MFCGNCGKSSLMMLHFVRMWGKAQKLDAPISEEKNIPAIPEKAQQKKQGKLKSIFKWYWKSNHHCRRNIFFHETSDK